MKRSLLLFSAIFVFASCTNEWDKEDEAAVKQRCQEFLDCDCYLKKAKEHFEDVDAYNEGKESNQDFIDSIHECLKEDE